jgi:predicted transcriptional regulator
MDEQRKILSALSTFSEPAGLREIGEAAGIPWKSVLVNLKELRLAGLLEKSSVKGKFLITDKGRETVT